MLVCGPRGRVRPQALLRTDVDLPVSQVTGLFERRWAMEASF